MPFHREVDARSLLRPYLHTPAGVFRADAVFPFFTDRLRVRMLLMALRGDRLVVTGDLPERVARRTLFYQRADRLEQPLATVNPREIGPLLHFDPWWLLRERTDLPGAVRRALVATNISGRKVAGGKLATVYFDGELSTVVAARITGGPHRRGRVRGDLLFDIIRAARWSRDDEPP